MKRLIMVAAVVAVGLGVMGPASPAGADIPPPFWYCAAFKPHPVDVLDTYYYDTLTPSEVVVGCIAYHLDDFEPYGRDYHCYEVHHNANGVIFWDQFNC